VLLNAGASPLGAPLTVAQCEHYALTRPGVVSTLIGCVSGAEVRQALAYETLSLEEKDYTAVLAASRRYAADGACMYCNHCLPCPQQIDIAAVHKYYDLAKNLERNAGDDPRALPGVVCAMLRLYRLRRLRGKVPVWRKGDRKHGQSSRIIWELISLHFCFDGIDEKLFSLGAARQTQLPCGSITPPGAEQGRWVGALLSTVTIHTLPAAARMRRLASWKFHAT